MHACSCDERTASGLGPVPAIHFFGSTTAVLRISRSCDNGLAGGSRCCGVAYCQTFVMFSISEFDGENIRLAFFGRKEDVFLRRA